MTLATNHTDIPLIPTPRLMRADGSTAVLAAVGCIGEGPSAAACDASGHLMRLIRRDLETYAGLRWRSGRGGVGRCDIRLDIDDAMADRSYRLDVARHADGSALVRIAGGDVDGLRYGVQTFRQLVRHSGPAIPVAHIEDAPVLPVRGYYLDVTRGRVPTLASLKALVDVLELHKYNQLQLYVEHAFRFDGLSQAWRGTGALGTDDILELDEYCAKAGIELVPSISTFGHQYMALRTDRYAGLGEFPEQAGRPFSLIERMEHHTLNPLMDESLALAKRLIDQYAPLFRSRRFNICADETFDLGKGRSKSLADELGEKTLYVRHVKALCEYLVSQGCTPMFWGDIMWRFPQSCAELPKETICLNWGYLPNQRENEIRDIAASGITQYACPGVCGWNRWVPLYRYSYSNIRAMCHHAHKYHAIGLLNTDWGDYAHINDPRLTIPGILYGAAFGWNAQPVEMDELNEAVSRIEYGDTSGALMAALTDLSDHEVFDWQHAVNWMDGDEARRAELLAELDLTQVPAANAAVADALARITACAATLPAGRKEIISLAAVTAEIVTLWNQIGAWLAGPRTEDPALAARLEHWYALYLAQWRQVSRESGLPNLTRLITRYADLLRGRQLRAG